MVRGLPRLVADAEWSAARAQAAARLSGLGVPVEALAGLRPCLRLARDPGGTSRLGGRPRLGPGVAWPHREGRPLEHLAQIDLAGSPPVARSLGLPGDGLLTFFFDLEPVAGGSGGWGYDWPRDTGTVVVLLLDAQTAVRPAAWPSALAREQRPEGVAVRWELQADLASLVSETSSVRLSDRAHNDVLDLMTGQGPDHKLLGSPLELQGPPLDGFPTLARNPGHPPPDQPDLRAPDSRDWRPLLQIDTETGDGLDLMWGDSGVLFVGAQHRDLMAGRWDRCWAMVVGH